MRDVLRLGAYQVLRTRIPPHAAVATPSIWCGRSATRARPGSSTPCCARSPRSTGTAGPTGWAATPRRCTGWRCAPRTRNGSPQRSPTRSAATRTRPRVALAADDERPQTHLVAWPGRIDRDELLAAAGGAPGPWSPYAVRLDGGDPARSRPCASDRAGVQDEGSQLCALALAARPARRPGRALARPVRRPRRQDRAAGRAGRRARRRGDGQRAAPAPGRAGAPGDRAVGRRGHGRRRARGRRPIEGGYDRVLVDAPCTGLGALRRRPEARWRRDPSDVAAAGRTAGRAARRGAAPGPSRRAWWPT